MTTLSVGETGSLRGLKERSTLSRWPAPLGDVFRHSLFLPLAGFFRAACFLSSATFSPGCPVGPSAGFGAASSSPTQVIIHPRASALFQCRRIKHATAFRMSLSHRS